MYEKKLQKFFKTVFLNGQAKWDFQLDKKVDKVFWKSRSFFFFKSSVYFRSYLLVAQEKHECSSEVSVVLVTWWVSSVPASPPKGNQANLVLVWARLHCIISASHFLFSYPQALCEVTPKYLA